MTVIQIIMTTATAAATKNKRTCLYLYHRLKDLFLGYIALLLKKNVIHCVFYIVYQFIQFNTPIKQPL